MTGIVVKDAQISSCEKYRYSLSRVWNKDDGLVLWVMLNPSTADAATDDPTIRRCINFTKGWGYGGLFVVNLFALRATNPKALRGRTPAVGPVNDITILMATKVCELIVAAWGTHGTYLGRDRVVATALKSYGSKVYCLGKTKDGYPKHPLYVPAGVKLVKF